MSDAQFMFDTNIFNQILDDNFDLSMLNDRGSFFTTHIQQDEINNTKDEDRKKSLLQVFVQVNSEKKPTESMVWDVSKWGEAKWTDNNVPTSSFIVGQSRVGGAKLGDGQKYSQLLELLDQDKPRQHQNNIKDALIGETAMKNNFTLITNDASLLNRSKELGANVQTFEEFTEDHDERKNT